MESKGSISSYVTSCGNVCMKGLNNMFASTINLGSFRVVSQPVRVNTAGTLVLLGVATQEKVVSDGHGGFKVELVKVPVVPSNSIFGNGEKCRIQFGTGWHTIDSVDISTKVVELVRQLDTTGGTVRKVEWFAVSGIDANILKMAKFGKTALPGTVLEVASKRATDFVVQKVLNPGTQGVALWSPWASSIHLDIDQVGFGARSARKVWNLAVQACAKLGVELSEHETNLVFTMPELMNDALLIVNRQPVHSSDNLMTMRMVVTDSPLAAPSVRPELMKLMGGDEDGDPCAIFTGEHRASVQSFINKVRMNIASRLGCGLLAVYGLDYNNGSSVGRKGDKVADVSLAGVKFDNGNLWSDFQGFKVKSVIGLLCTAVWQYAWAFARLLTTEELIGFGTDYIARESDVARVEKMQGLVTRVTKSPERLKSERVAQLATELTYCVFRDMFEHIFDARKGTVLGYDPIDNLKALSRTGKFDWSGMEAEGLWTAPLRVVSARIWTAHENEEGKSFFKYSVRELVQQYDPEYFQFVSDRGNGWKNGFNAVNVLLDSLKGEGLMPLVKSLYLQGGYIEKTTIEVPEKFQVPGQKGELVDLLEDARPGRVFAQGPRSLVGVHEWLAAQGVNGSINMSKDGVIDGITIGGVTKLIPAFKVKRNDDGFGSGRISPYVGCYVQTETTLRAIPPVLIHEGLNPFCLQEGNISQEKFNSKFPGLDPNGFLVLGLYGVMAHIMVGACQTYADPKKAAQLAASRIRSFINKCELVRNDIAGKVFGDMITVNLRSTGISSEWSSLFEDYTAMAVHEAGFSLYAVSKNAPCSKFLIIDPALGVPRLVAAYDPFWAIRTARRYDREALSTLRQLRRFEKPVGSSVSDNLGLAQDLAGYRQNVTLAFFNTEANEGGHDPVDFCPTGMVKAKSSDCHWVWMSERDKSEFFSNLDEDSLKITYRKIREMKQSREVVKEVQIDEDIMVKMYFVPVDLGNEDTTGLSFKGNFAGTKSMVKQMGKQLLASYTPIKSLNTLSTRLAARDKSQVIMVDGVMPADTIVAKGAWSLVVEAAASRLNDGFVLDTIDPQVIVDEVVPAIAARLEAEGKPGDGKMFIYQVTDSGIVPVLDADGKVLRAVVGDVPMYRIPFEADFNGSMTKYRKGGIDKLGHIERVLINEVPTITVEQRIEMTLIVNDLMTAQAGMGTTKEEVIEGDYFEL